MIGRFLLAVTPLFAGSTDQVSSLSMAGRGATAPSGRWSTRGGCAARTGVAESGPEWTHPERAWSLTAPGPIEGEPLCWDSRVVISSLQGTGVRRLQVLDLWTGREEHAAIVVRTPVPLEPSLYGDTTLVRSGERDLTAYHLGGHRPTPIFSWTASSPVSPALLVESEIYVGTNDGLARLDLARREPLWTLPGSFRGTPSMLGDIVFSVRYEDAVAHLVAVDRATGAERSSAVLGVHTGAPPSPGSDLPRITVTPGEVFVRHASPLRTEGGRALSASRVARRADGTLQDERVRLLGLPAPLVPWDTQVVGFFETSGGSVFGSSYSGAATIESWADPQVHGDLLEFPVAPSRSERICFVGGRVIDLDAMRILWRLPDHRGRAVLAGDTLLSVRNGRHLEAWRDSGRPTVRELARLETELERDLAAEFLDLAADARRARDPELLRRLVQEARIRGAAGPQLATLEDYADMLDQQRGLRPNTSEVNAVIGRERDLGRFVVDGLWKEAVREGPSPLGLRLAEEVLLTHPDPREASDWVRDQLPAELVRRTRFDALEWLHFLDATQRSPTTILRPDSLSGSTPDWRRYEHALDSWRNDLLGFRSEHLLIVSPPSRPGSVARCLSMGEVVCRALESMFGRSVKTSAADEPLVLHVFESRNEYLGRSREAGNGGHADLDWTEGHYDPVANLARLYLPEDDAGLRSVFETFAHELTHQWLQNRVGGRASSSRPGFWIVEGFASMVEEFRFDPRTGTWESENPQSHRLDIAANAGSKRLAWAAVFGASQEDFLQLSAENVHGVPSSWYLGRRASLSDRAIYYHQAAAAARYLYHADGGRHRPALLRYVLDYYAGRAAGLDVRAAFGLAPDELGGRIAAYAREARD